MTRQLLPIVLASFLTCLLAAALSAGNNVDALGDDEAVDSVAPVGLGAGRTATAVSTASSHTCALLDTGDVRCWGNGTEGKLGNADTGTIGDGEAITTIGTVDVGVGRTVLAFEASILRTCALLDDGSVRRWGRGDDGALGYANAVTIGDDEVPSAAGPVVAGVSLVTAVADVDVRAAVSSPSIALGAAATMTVELEVVGPDAPDSAIVRVAVPSNATIGSSTASRGHYNSSTGFWHLSDLAVGSTQTLTFTSTGGAPGTGWLTAEVLRSDNVDPDRWLNSFRYGDAAVASLAVAGSAGATGASVIRSFVFLDRASYGVKRGEHRSS